MIEKLEQVLRLFAEIAVKFNFAERGYMELGLMGPNLIKILIFMRTRIGFNIYVHLGIVWILGREINGSLRPLACKPRSTSALLSSRTLKIRVLSTKS